MSKSRKPRVFVGSSGESLRYAYAVKKTLTAMGVDVTVWQEDVFKVASYALESLFQAAWAHDFAVFIFADDDVVIKRRHRQKAVRDNVLFELGLFMGRLGRERTFVTTPKGANLALPSDLAGWTVTRYNPSLKSAVAAMKGASRQICEAIRLLGNFDPAVPSRDVTSAATLFERASSGPALHFDRRTVSVVRPIGSPVARRYKASVLPSRAAASGRRPSKRKARRATSRNPRP